ncbi:substrate-binding domain-containing protein [Geodermatophilus sp. YIM 151500]|uniref:substrate-binding domain-containing protein n=1 Tax=Geodermatophilus sp. YIM 151500 TaxID=2984531 RepID=UPI0021E3CDC0|nr:substrate-binding domain-containing protein [Geodermatophilus sp. YIM 151500]MCV2490267.1 substrate-binding domain-containing protein [Geodermatophilus sp. YIM 151500]
MRSIGTPMKAAVGFAAVGLALAACSSEGGARNQPGAAGAAGGEEYTIAMVTHEAPGDTFWDKIRAGAEAAAANHGITLNYSNNQDAGEQATLVQNAIDSGVDGLATTLPTPDAIGPTVQDAVDAGIPTVAFNAGINDYQNYGVTMYFGSDEDLAGQTVGTKISEENAGHTVCVIQEQGQVQLEARCAGVQKTFPDTEILYVSGRDLPAVQQTIGAKLQQDPSIANVVALGADIALAANQAKADSGSQAQVVTFDLNADVAQAIESGEILFSVDQQPYVQGYMAVTSLWLNLTNGNDIGGGGPVLTGPSVVDQTNIGPIVEYAQNNTR